MPATAPISATTAQEGPLPLGARYPALDGVRGLAVCLLLLAHLLVLKPADGATANVVASTIRMSWICIDIFFCLSAFLITGILLQTRDSKDYFRSFYGRRFLRIFPLYYLLLFIIFVVVPKLSIYGYGNHFWINGRESPLWYFGFAENVRLAVTGDYAHRLLSVAWTLSVEEQFYVVWPFLVYFTRPERLARVCLILIGVAVAVRFGLYAIEASPKVVHTFTFSRMDGIAFGSYLAIRCRDRAFVNATINRLPQLFFAFAAALVLGAVFVRLFQPSTKFTEFVYSQFFQTLGYTISVGFAGVLVMSAAYGHPGGIAQRFWCSKPLQVLGTYSFGLYLLHEPVIYLLRRHHVFNVTDFADRPLLAQLLNYTVIPSVTLVVAMASWHFFEAPILRLKRFFPYRRDAAKAAP
ncbi:MAG TPA: acyltransferase [Planctomycetota bacterium]|nr:acyltransferase [Planctomycetota bacterium]